MKMDNKGNMIPTENIFAGKIVSKQLLVKPHQKDKMAQEISIHRALNNKHVVGFHSFFEDTNFVYIVLELCKRRVISAYCDVNFAFHFNLNNFAESDGASQEKEGHH